MPKLPENYNITNELAKERNRAAAERTLMAWIRTSLSLISFGIGIDRTITALSKAFADSKIDPYNLSRILGLSFIIIGTSALILAVIIHNRSLKKLDKEYFIYTSGTSLGSIVAIALIMLGTFAFIGILIKG
jgi:putative membrane protein